VIEAYFQGPSGTVVPCIMPDSENRLLEIAGAIGLSADDMFSVEIPAGASRHTRVRALISRGRISDLYQVGEAGPYFCYSLFRWREGTKEDWNEVLVYLKPPRPLMTPVGTVATANGLVMIEAVDARFWWARSQTSTNNYREWFGPQYSTEGKFQDAPFNILTFGTPWLLAQLIEELPIQGNQINTNDYVLTPADPAAPRVALESIYRLIDYRLTPDCSLGFAIDLILSLSGWMLVFDPSQPYQSDSVYKIVPIGSSQALLRSWMLDNKRVVAGGLEPTSASAANEQMLALWGAGDALGKAQINRMPYEVTMAFPYRTVEGKTLYDIGSPPRFDEQTFWNTQEYIAHRYNLSATNAFHVPTTRLRASLGALTLRESWPLRSRDLGVAIDPNDLVSYAEAEPVSASLAGFITVCTGLLGSRCNVDFGTTAWAGWPAMPNGAYRGTMLRYVLRMVDGAVVPLTITEAREDDWIFGPDGLPISHPSQLIVGKGKSQSRRLSSGATLIDVPPPRTRVFAAKITGATKVGTSGSDFWRWIYTWEEVVPNPLGETPLAQDIFYEHERRESLGSEGARRAKNLTEAGNTYVGPISPSNVIANGVRQIDYMCQAIVEPLPVNNGTIVLMVEQTLDQFDNGPPNAAPYDRQFWFSTPNAVKTTCYTCLTNDDYGTFDAPSGLDNDYGTFDAPEGDTDYGVF
jgi:hypothetical protein